MTTHDLDELNSIDVPQDEERGDGLPRIWWKYGNQQAKAAGHFYARADDWDGPLPAPWAECELYEGEVGYKAESLRLLPITKRSQPYRKVTVGDRDRREYAERWSEGMQIHTEYLVFVEGLEGPVVWSFHGVTGKAMEGKGGIIPTASRAIAYEATKLYKRKIGLSAFWLPIGPTLDARGKTHFEKLAQGSVVNAPALRLPADLEGRALLQAFYAGKETIAEVAMVKEQYAAWRLERRTNEEPEPVAVATGRNGDGRNAPQELADDDIL